MLYTSHEYVVNVMIFFHCVSLIELNAQEDEAYKFYKKGKKKKIRPKRMKD